ncbi:hypothetical protein C8J56DRAFT_955350 [Mycena floridula]|nr:hypothetical protein C8J56DRAFT_955350 [Mycena floridula]
MNRLHRLVSTGRLPQELCLWENYLSIPEQTILLRASLQKLNATESRAARHRRKLAASAPEPSNSGLGVFLSDTEYEWQSGHYDGVIVNYREMHLTSWPDDIPDLSPILERLHSLLPKKDHIQTHLLHLASNGYILPHVDNVGASGTWIFGASLGAERILRMQGPDASQDFDVLLPSGSVYLQRDSLRYQYRHSIPQAGSFLGRELDGGQRVSIMIRDLKAELPG